MMPSTETLQYLLEKRQENVKFRLEMTRIPRRTIYNNLKKFILGGNYTRKEGSGRRTKFNTIDRRRLL